MFHTQAVQDTSLQVIFMNDVIAQIVCLGALVYHIGEDIIARKHVLSKHSSVTL